MLSSFIRVWIAVNYMKLFIVRTDLGGAYRV